MTDKEIIIDGVNVSGCTYSKIGIDKKNYCEQDLYDDGTPVFTCDECTNCYFKQLKRKEQECEDLRQYHNKCCEEFKKEKQDLIDKYNQLSINFYNGDYCNTEHCSLLKSKEKECEKLEQTLIETKEIAGEDFNHTCWETYARQLEQILQKISEREVE